MSGLINADELMDFIENRISDGSEDPASQYTIIRDEALMELGRMVKSMETVDAEPVKHAHWVERRSNNGNMHYICSHCGKESEEVKTGGHMKYSNLKVKDLIEELKDLPQDTPLQIVYFNEDTPGRRIECDIHDCVTYGASEKPVESGNFLPTYISLEIVGRNNNEDY